MFYTKVNNTACHSPELIAVNIAVKIEINETTRSKRL